MKLSDRGGLYDCYSRLTKRSGEDTGGRTADAEADRTFVREVRELVAQLKRLARQMEQRLHQAGDSRADKDLNQAGQKLADIEKNLSEMTGCVQLWCNSIC